MNQELTIEVACPGSVVHSITLSAVFVRPPHNQQVDDLEFIAGCHALTDNLHAAFIEAGCSALNIKMELKPHVTAHPRSDDAIFNMVRNAMIDSRADEFTIRAVEARVRAFLESTSVR